MVGIVVNPLDLKLLLNSVEESVVYSGCLLVGGKFLSKLTDFFSSILVFFLDRGDTLTEMKWIYWCCLLLALVGGVL